MSKEESHKGNPYKISKNWMYVTLLANIAMGPISALIILQILGFGGNVLDAGYAITLGTAITIPASYFWGKISDIYNSRRKQIIISYIGVAITLVGLYYSLSIVSLIFWYVLFNFFAVANATPLNLLVMETTPKEHWPSVFGKLQMFSSVGTTIGYVVAVYATNFISLNSLPMLLFIVCAIAILMANKLIFSPPIKSTRQSIVRNSFAFVSRMLMHPILFVAAPTKKLLNKISSLQNRNETQTNYVTLLYVAGFVFFLGSGLFNTVYPAALKQFGLTESNVFLVLFMGLLLQTTTFFYSGRFVETHLTPIVIKQSLILRGAAYGLVGLTFFMFSGNNILWSNIILYPIATGIAFSLYYTASYSLVFKALKGIDNGSALGVFSAIAAVGTLVGALLSGEFAYSYGYAVTFVLAGVLMLITVYIFSKMPMQQILKKKGSKS